MMLEEPLTFVMQVPVLPQAEQKHLQELQLSGQGCEDAYCWADPVELSGPRSSSIGRIRKGIHAREK